MHQKGLEAGLRPDPVEGAYSAPPKPLAELDQRGRGRDKGREKGESRREGFKGEREGKRTEGMG